MWYCPSLVFCQSTEPLRSSDARVNLKKLGQIVNWPKIVIKVLITLWMEPIKILWRECKWCQSHNVTTQSCFVVIYCISERFVDPACLLWFCWVASAVEGVIVGEGCWRLGDWTDKVKRAHSRGQSSSPLLLRVLKHLQDYTGIEHSTWPAKNTWTQNASMTTSTRATVPV